MKGSIYWLMLVSLVSNMAVAQSSIEDELNKELDQLYSQSGSSQPINANTEVVNVPESRSIGTPVVNSGNSQPVYIIQQAPQNQSAPQAQKQPTTYIESSPLKKSRADAIREARQEAEVETETKLVEKLEESRIEDEKRRADALFGERFNKMNERPAAPAIQPEPTPIYIQQVPVQAAPVVVQHVQEVEPVEPVEDVSIRDEVRAALVDYNEESSNNNNIYESKTFMGVSAGIGEYNASNVAGQYALGFSVGSRFRDRWVVEGSFNYSRYQIEKTYNSGYAYGSIYGYNNYAYNGVYYGYLPKLIDMEQYTGGATVKYQMLSGMFRPVLGATGTYSYRSYSSDSSLYWKADSANTHAIDVGLVTGVDLDLDPEYSVGLDFRYMWNLSNRTDDNYQRYYLNPLLNEEKVESISYYMLSIVGKAYF